MKIKELGHVVLYVTNIQTMADFYRDTLGFHEISRDSHTAVFSGGRTHHELLLIEIGGEIKNKSYPEPGLYHIGFKIGDDNETLKKAIKELQEKRVRIIGSADHAVTHSLYIKDPEGNELELYVDISDEWKKNPRAIMARTKPLPLN